MAQSLGVIVQHLPCPPELCGRVGPRDPVPAVLAVLAEERKQGTVAGRKRKDVVHGGVTRQSPLVMAIGLWTEISWNEKGKCC